MPPSEEVMERCFIVVEGPADAILLRELPQLPEGDTRVQIIVGGGWSAADSLARSLLASGRGDVALVVDADSVDPSLVRQREQFLEQSLREIGSRGRQLVVVFAPELEALLFQHPGVLESLVGHPVSPTDLVRGRYEPKKVLSELIGSDSLHTVFAQRLPGRSSLAGPNMIAQAAPGRDPAP